jgi:hypothetical protein
MRSVVGRLVRGCCGVLIVTGCGDDGPGPQGPEEVELTSRRGHSMVYDEARRHLLLFGGTGAEETSLVGDLSSTWRWDGTQWIRLATSGPSGRYSASVAYDANRQRVVLFGGQAGTFPNIAVLTDTWEWDGTSWTRRATTGPSSRVHQTMAFDRSRGRVVLYGGFNAATQQEMRDIWEWDGTSWQQTGSATPAGSIARGAAYDETTGALSLFSVGSTGALVADRWTGTALAAAAAATPPCVPFQSQLASLGSNPGGLLLYIQGCDASGTAAEPQTWRWDGAAWTRVAGPQPPLRYNSAMAFDRDRGRVVLFGGEVGQGTPDRDDTWEFDGTAWTRK